MATSPPPAMATSPTSPRSPERARPGSRGSRILSFGSRRSSGGSSSLHRLDLSESAKEKHARRMTTKADPNLAMNESQPAALALEQNTITPLRSIQHRDSQGQVITDPDRSNPTRPRMERPLDTIRSFEAAFDKDWERERRRSAFGPQGDSGPRASRLNSMVGTADMGSRRSSAAWYSNQGPPPPGFRAPGGRMPRPESYADPYRPSPPLGGPPFQRNRSDPVLYGNNLIPNGGGFAKRASGYGPPGPPPAGGPPQMYDSAANASASGTEPWANSTDPSSENSSVDRIAASQVMKNGAGPSSAGAPPKPPPHMASRPPPDEGYPGPHPPQHGRRMQPRQPLDPMGPPPPPPAHAQHNQRAPPSGPPANGQAGPSGQRPSMQKDPSSSRPANTLRRKGTEREKAPVATVKPVDSKEKRKSWFKRTFGKS